MTSPTTGPTIGTDVLPSRGPDEVLLGFTRALRAAGVPVTHDRSAGYLQAVSLAGLADADVVRTAGRATLCGSPDDLRRHDQVFEAYFGGGDLPRPSPAAPAALVFSELPLDDGAGSGEAGDDDVRPAMASDAEVLRHRDVAGLSPAERQRLALLLDTLRPRAPRRRTGRYEPWRRGHLDATRTLRASLRRMGEPATISFRRRRTRPRRIVLLIDVSGSMSSYADVLLRLAHRLTHALADGSRARVETFTVGTRLTHLTRPLQMRDPDRALVAAGETVPDWSGGTRLGETLGAFADLWGRRGLARGAVVVVFSDGWERGEVDQLGEQVRRLHLVAHRVVWVNPHRGKAGYEPVQAGIRAVLPYVDDFVAGHSLATYAELVEVIADA